MEKEARNDKGPIRAHGAVHVWDPLGPASPARARNDKGPMGPYMYGTPWGLSSEFFYQRCAPKDTTLSQRPPLICFFFYIF